jgi:hypothetical protein
MSTETIVIIIVLIVLFGGGGIGFPDAGKTAKPFGHAQRLE